jgi:beta-glucosidase
VRASRRYRLPIYITENGISHPEDAERSRFLRQHLCALSHAIHDRGADVRGYFYWSLLDNQEWANGYATRMGLYAVDYETSTRTLRPVGADYADVIRSRVVYPAAVRPSPKLSWQPGLAVPPAELIVPARS